MTFPVTPLDVLVALYYDDAWHEITADALSREPITIERGRADEGQRVDHTKCKLMLNNGASRVAPGVTGRYSPRNPYSDLFGKIGRNVPVKVAVRAGTPWLDVPGGFSRARTPDGASLDIVGDIDIRVDAALATWRAGDTLTELAGKYTVTGNQRSWIFMIAQDGRLVFRWSADGTATIQVSSTVPVTPPPTGRLTVRVTLDVNDGAGNRVVTFYQGPSTSGPWTEVETLTAAGTTSIFNSTAPIDVGDLGSLGFLAPVGKYYGFQLRNGIGGTAVADVDFTAQSVGDTSFADTAGLTWTLENGASITNERIRFLGEISNWPPRWDVSGRDAWMPVEAGGILRRLGQGATPLQSALRRQMTADDATRPVAYWPVEEDAQATLVASGLGGTAMTVLGQPEFAAFADFACSKPIVTMKDGSTLTGRVATYTATGQTQIRWLCNVPATGGPADSVLLRVNTTGTAARWDVVYRTGGALEVIVYDTNNTQIATSNAVAFAVDGKLLRISLQLEQVGADAEFRIGTFQVDGGGVSDPNAVAATTVGVVWKVTVAPDQDIDNVSFGHIAVYDVITSIFDLDNETNAWNGEAAGERIERLCRENGVAFSAIGGAMDDTALMGVQRVDTLLSLLHASADADVSALIETRDQVGLGFRTRRSYYGQAAALELSYATDGHIHPPFDPEEDDQTTKNQVTASREGGSSALASQQTGPLSILAPPDGVGLYDSSVTVNVQADAHLPDQASWRVHLGTTDEPRYSQIHVNLAAAPDLIDAACELDTGLRLTVSDPPVWIPPEDVDQLVQGYTEIIGHPIDWDLYFNCVPFSPYVVGVYDDSHRQTEGSELATAVDSDDTTLNVLTTAGLIWTTRAADMPLDIVAGGERMTVTAIASVIADAFGRTSASSWGNADSGQTWQNLGGSASDFAVGSGYGSHTLATVDVTRRNAIAAVDPDCDFYGSITTSALATGASLFGAITCRMLDSENMYMARLEFTTTNTIVLVLRKIVANVGTDLGTFTLTGVTHVAGTFIRVRLQATGSTLRAKAWPAAGNEPDRWHIAVTDTSLTAADNIGTRSIRTTGNTNAGTVQIRYDDFAVVNPQRFTVTRSVNTIVKAHAAGTSVRVYRPAVRAL